MGESLRKMGRPKLPPEKQRRKGFSFRTTDEIHALVCLAARESGRSLAQELEFRILKSFDGEEDVKQRERLAIFAHKRIVELEGCLNRLSRFFEKNYSPLALALRYQVVRELEKVQGK